MKVPVPPSGHRLASTQAFSITTYSIDAHPEDPSTPACSGFLKQFFTFKYLNMLHLCTKRNCEFLSSSKHCTECFDEEVLPFGGNNANLCNSAGGHLKGQHAVVTFAAFCRYVQMPCNWVLLQDRVQQNLREKGLKIMRCLHLKLVKSIPNVAAFDDSCAS